MEIFIIVNIIGVVFWVDASRCSEDSRTSSMYYFPILFILIEIFIGHHISSYVSVPLYFISLCIYGVLSSQFHSSYNDGVGRSWRLLLMGINVLITTGVMVLIMLYNIVNTGENINILSILGGVFYVIVCGVMTLVVYSTIVEIINLKNTK